MLVIVSDLHLTDDTSGTTIDSNAFHIFYWRLRDLAYAASSQEINGKEVYNPIGEIHLLLLGDILDVIRSSRWLQSDVRPWHDPNSDAFSTKLKEITDAILEKNNDALTMLQSLGRSGLNIRKEKDSHEEKHHVDVFIHYVVGNHDWFYHLPGPKFDAIRASIIKALGLANDPAEVFPYDTEESPAIMNICEQHQVFARHGDKFDGANFDGPDRNHSSLGDAIVIELLNRFSYEVQNQLGPDVAKGLKEIDNVRPVELIPTYVDGLLQRSKNKDQAAQVRDIWNSVVSSFLKNDFVRKHHSSLKWGLRLSKGFSFHKLGKLVPILKAQAVSLMNLFPFLDGLACKLGLSDEYYKSALREPVFSRPDISYIVYGHTHHHEIVPLRSGTGSGTNHEDVYINSGTWRAVFDLAKYQPKDAEFFAYHVMNYIAFFKGDERKGKAFEAWSGSLEYPVATGLPAATVSARAAAAD